MQASSPIFTNLLFLKEACYVLISLLSRDFFHILYPIAFVIFWGVVSCTTENLLLHLSKLKKIKTKFYQVKKLVTQRVWT